MAAGSYHTRSNSFPTRSHPLTFEVCERLRRLRSSKDAASTSSSSIGCEINGLGDLYESVDKMLQLPLVQQALAQGQNMKWVDELLNGSLMILDVSSIAQDALLQIKVSVQGLQSVFRRKRGNESELGNEMKKYLASRKAVKKSIHTALGNFKGMEKKCSSLINEEHVSMLKEAEGVTLAAFQSLLSFISGSKTTSKLSSLTLVSKLIRPKRIVCKEDDKEMNEFEKVDAAWRRKSDNIQHQLKELESSIQDLEEGLESLSRHLIKARVSLLNILTK